MPVLEQDMTMYEMSTSWSHSLSFSLIHSLTQASTTADIARSQCKGHKSHYSTFLGANGGFNMRCCISDGVYLLYNPLLAAFKPLHNKIDLLEHSI